MTCYERTEMGLPVCEIMYIYFLPCLLTFIHIWPVGRYCDVTYFCNLADHTSSSQAACFPARLIDIPYQKSWQLMGTLDAGADTVHEENFCGVCCCCGVFCCIL